MRNWEYWGRHWQDGTRHTFTPAVEDSQDVEIYDPVQVEPKLVVLPWFPQQENNHNRFQLQVRSDILYALYWDHHCLSRSRELVVSSRPPARHILSRATQCVTFFQLRMHQCSSNFRVLLYILQSLNIWSTSVKCFDNLCTCKSLTINSLFSLYFVISLLQATGGSGNYSWLSSEADVATVTTRGEIVTAVKKGEALVKATDTKNHDHYDMMQVSAWVVRLLVSLFAVSR